MARFFPTLRDAAARFSSDGCGFLAQAIAFNAFFALFPLAVLLLAGASAIFPHADRRTLEFFDTFSPTLHSFVAANLRSYIYGRGISSLVALVVVVWSGKNLFLGLAFALDRAVGVPKGRPFMHGILYSLVMLPLIGVLVILAMSLPVVLAVVVALTGLPDAHYLAQFVAYSVSLSLVFFVCMTLYTVLPNARLPWRFAVPGAILVTLIWPLLQFLFELYIGHVDFTHIYGALSAPIVLLLWFYVIASLFLFGAELCVAWSARSPWFAELAA